MEKIEFSVNVYGSIMSKSFCCGVSLIELLKWSFFFPKYTEWSNCLEFKWANLSQWGKMLLPFVSSLFLWKIGHMLNDSHNWISQKIWLRLPVVAMWFIWPVVYYCHCKDLIGYKNVVSDKLVYELMQFSIKLLIFKNFVCSGTFSFFHSSLFHKSFYWLQCSFFAHFCHVLDQLSERSLIFFFLIDPVTFTVTLSQQKVKEENCRELLMGIFSLVIFCANRSFASTLHCVWASCKFLSTQATSPSLGDGIPVVPGSGGITFYIGFHYGVWL